MKKKIENLSMQTQLTVVILSVIVLAFGIILYSGYSGQARSFAEEYTSSTQTILEMDVANLDQYIQGLRIFCVQPCLNVSVYNSLLKRKPLSSSEISDIKQEIQSSYHSRTDIRSYSITAMNQDLCFERNAGVGGQHILSTPVKDTEISRPYIACGSNDKYEYLAPPDSEDVFFRYYHYLIRLRNREPVSLSYVDVDTTQLRLLMKNHQDYGQILCLYNSDGELLYSSSEDIRNQEEKEKKQLFGLHSDVENVNIGGISYLALRRTSEETGIVLLSLLPKSAWDDRARDFLLPLVMQIAVITICLIIIVTLMIRMITIPLKRLSYQMGKMGEGDFSPTAFGGGCKETCALTESYNDMAAHINELIETNYISSINEKNSRLQALEAQLNPHFLYNTLQAIATEALLADCQEIYDMIVSLSANLRYTIKGGELVRLQEELDYVDRYILLQKTRLGGRLEVTKKINPKVNLAVIPKISIQMLVENAIIHGMPENGAVLHIIIRVCMENNRLLISVYDDGKGLLPEKVKELNDIFSGKSADTGNSIGLPNLASRLKILYQGEAGLFLESQGDQFTEVKMELPIRKRENENV